MKKLLINENNKIRSGWWIGLFIGLIVVTQFIYRPLTQGLRALEISPYIVDATAVVFILLVTFICIRLRKEKMQDVGMQVNGQWSKEFIVGTALGGLWLLAVALPLWLVGGVSFSVNAEATVQLILLGFYAFLLGALLEELLHRGFIFQRLIDGLGFWPAQIIIALIFAFGHLGNPEMDGTRVVFVCIDLALASLIFGLAYWRTKSLALPTGLHLGWNWFQGSILGFPVSGHESGGLLTAEISNQAAWITGGKFGLEGSVFSILVSLIALYLIWQWKGVQSVTKSLKDPLMTATGST